jgi:hypothetical protein
MIKSNWCRIKRILGNRYHNTILFSS